MSGRGTVRAAAGYFDRREILFNCRNQVSYVPMGGLVRVHDQRRHVSLHLKILIV